MKPQQKWTVPLPGKMRQLQGRRVFSLVNPCPLLWKLWVLPQQELVRQVRKPVLSLRGDVVLWVWLC